MAKSALKLATVRTIADLRKQVAAWHRRAPEGSNTLVPTMGALHDGHLALVKEGLKRADRAVVTLFVNPAQFGPNEDFSRYPRDEDGDRAKLAKAGADLLYAPNVAEMYPEGFATSVSAGPMAELLDGKFRPGHFGGVATVVAKLLIQAGADFACFGEKDYQQLQIITRMARDLDYPRAHRRREDGTRERRWPRAVVAQRLSVAGGTQDRAEPASMCSPGSQESGCMQGATTVQAVGWGLFELNTAGFASVDYLAVVDAATLKPPLDELDRPARILVAAWLGRTRLIDNEPLMPISPSAGKRPGVSRKARKGGSSR